VARITLDINSEASLWCMAGAKRLSSLGLDEFLQGVSSWFVNPPTNDFFGLFWTLNSS
jgi:hypothetical protein